MRKLLAAAALAAGCGLMVPATPPESAAPVRLLSAADPGLLAEPEAQLQLERVPEDQRLPPSFLRGGIRMAPDYPAGRLAKIPMFLPGNTSGRDERASLLSPSSGSRYHFVAELPPNAELRTAVGYTILPDAIGRTVRFQVMLVPRLDPGAEGAEGAEDTAPLALLDERVTVREDGSWLPLTADLSAWAGREVELDFSVTEGADDDGPNSGPPTGAGPVWAGWASPEIVDAGGGVEPGLDLLWISLDTLRADRLGAYGYRRRPTSPNLDRLATSGVVFSSAVSQAPWTRPSHRSMFSGNYPSSNRGFASEPLALLLWRAGWRTGALTGGGQVDARFGFEEGFDGYRVHYWHQDLDAVDHWYAANDGRRNFLFLHTFAVHDPYSDHRFARAESLPPGRIEDRFGRAEWEHWGMRLTKEEEAYADALYDGGVAAIDEVLGELFARLEASGRLNRALIVVTADHGEQLFEHGGWRHGSEVYDHQILVPAILHLPPALRARLGDPPARIDQQIQLIDLYPTVLELLGVAQQHEVQGHSLVPLLRGETMEPWLAFTENVNIDRYERKSFRSENWKLVWQVPKGATGRPSDEKIRLYDLRRDPGETTDVSSAHADAVADHIVRMQRLIEGGAPPEDDAPEDIPPDLRERLQALGYVD